MTTTSKGKIRGMRSDVPSETFSDGWLAQLWQRGKSLFGRRGAGARLAAAHTLYATAVRQAREPVFYTSYGVPDTHDGRLELIQLHVILLLRRLQRGDEGGRLLGQALFDVFFLDLDRSLREGGVGDLSVGKWVKKIGQQFYARATAVEAALAQDDAAGLEAVLTSNVYAGLDEGTEAAALARYLLAADRDLAAQVAGGTAFPTLRFPPIAPIRSSP
jgi:cytochrome b pre-mRNA-processing protein 3